MSDPDTLRTSALSSLRALLLEASHNKGGTLSRQQTEEVFRSSEFASAVFRLFDAEGEGVLNAEDVISLSKLNFRG